MAHPIEPHFGSHTGPLWTLHRTAVKDASFVGRSHLVFLIPLNSAPDEAAQGDNRRSPNCEVPTTFESSSECG